MTGGLVTGGLVTGPLLHNGGPEMTLWQWSVSHNHCPVSVQVPHRHVV